MLPPHPVTYRLDEGKTIHNAQDLAEYFGFEIADIQTSLPDWVPTTDIILFEAYLKLYRQIRPIKYGPDGMFQTSGVDLGLFIAENKIKIAFEDKAFVDCGNCGKACVDRNNPDPEIASTIFIVDIGYAPVNLMDLYAGRIAHETFHLTFPYGKDNSVLEEMDTKRIESVFVGTYTPDANIVLDYSAEALTNWATEVCVNVYGPCAYENLPLYPNTAFKTLVTTLQEEANQPK